MSPNPFQSLYIGDGDLNRPQILPNQEMESPILIQKKKKTKITADTATTASQTKISATQYLYRARDAIRAAIDEEKEALGEEYIEDNDIQLLEPSASTQSTAWA